MKRRCVQRLLCASLLFVSATLAAADEATLAWLRDGRVEVRALSAASPVQADTAVPLGSVWKLFMHAYLTETQASEEAYVCSGQRGPVGDENLYCCEPGESVGRDLALARSCAPYFDPKRLGVSADAWRKLWRSHAVPAWVADLKNMRPDAAVRLDDLLLALAGLPAPSREAARHAVLQTAVAGYGRDAWAQLGTGVRYKTYSWHWPDGRKLGGAAGWLVDGTPFWLGANGSSRRALTRWAPSLAATFPPLRWDEVGREREAACVDVDFFARYPLRAVWRGNAKAQPGRLDGPHRLEFENGNSLMVNPRGSLMLNPGKVPTISGRFALNDYVARVLEREGGRAGVQAMRALAIAARSYLIQNAEFAGGCWHIADSTATQRVSPNPPGAAAQDAAWFTDDMVLDGVAVQYHRDQPATNRLSWLRASEQAANGWGFEQILSEAYPRANLLALDGSRECARLAAAEDWLHAAAPRWHKTLAREPGFEAPDGLLSVCAVSQGRPYADLQRRRIYVRGWRTLDERITLAHEYLHLALRFHPNGADEDYVERLARRLIEG